MEKSSAIGHEYEVLLQEMLLEKKIPFLGKNLYYNVATKISATAYITGRGKKEVSTDALC